MGGVGRMPHCADLIDKVSITSQIGAGRGAVRPGFERGRLVIANVAVQECRLGEFVRGGMTCRHEKAKISWASSLLSRVIRSRALDAGRVTVEDAIGRTTRAPGAYLRTLAYARISLPCRLARETIMLLGLRLM
jgi:hypothetical protein